jgi:D-glycerate 3-kinase
LIIGLAGGQGTGKTTITSIISLILKKYFKLKVFKISIDDFYKTRKERKKLSITKHPLLMTRGVPGTHDYRIISNFFKKIKNKKFNSLKLPKFDKSKDDRCHKKLWYKINSRPDVIILEGWCVGAKVQKNSQITKPINSLEKVKDLDLVWRKYVNTQLKIHCKNLFKQLNEIIYLRVDNFKILQQWRIKQEKALWLKSKNKKNLRIMSSADIINFMQTYQRITQNMFKDAPKYASIVMKLNSNHQINSIKFR